ncbi:hypothetical protein MMC07_001915 [Pseudocyphellaria aurata]|nr:hypothetical protein [Pseudocyphellaria aurata]
MPGIPAVGSGAASFDWLGTSGEWLLLKYRIVRLREYQIAVFRLLPDGLILSESGDWADGCAGPDYVLKDGETLLDVIAQEQGGATISATGSHPSATTPTSQSSTTLTSQSSSTASPSTEMYDNVQEHSGATISVSGSYPSATTPTSQSNSIDSPSTGLLSISDKIAIGIGVPVAVATILGTIYAVKQYHRKKTDKMPLNWE